MRVNIIGCAPGWQEAPFDNGARWGINDNHKLVKNIDLIFDCHNLKRVMKEKEQLGRRSIKEVREHLKLVKKKNIPMFCATTFKNIPSVMRYPIEDIVRRFKTDYFGSGPDYAIAYAVYKGYTEIHLYGILMAVGEESQFRNRLWSIGLAWLLGLVASLRYTTTQKLIYVRYANCHLAKPTG